MHIDLNYNYRKTQVTSLNYPTIAALEASSLLAATRRQKKHLWNCICYHLCVVNIEEHFFVINNEPTKPTIYDTKSWMIYNLMICHVLQTSIMDLGNILGEEKQLAWWISCYEKTILIQKHTEFHDGFNGAMSNDREENKLWSNIMCDVVHSFSKCINILTYTKIMCNTSSDAPLLDMSFTCLKRSVLVKNVNWKCE